MPSQPQRTHYIGNIGVRTSRGSVPRVSHLRVRRTNVYRVRGVSEACLSRLDPGDDHVFLVCSLAGTMSLRAGGDVVEFSSREMGMVRADRMELTTTLPSEIFVAVSPTAVLEALPLRTWPRSSTTSLVGTSTFLGGALEHALNYAFDATDANRGYLDPRVLDFVNVMARGMFHLPGDVDESPEPAVTLLHRARSVIAQLHADPATTPTTISALLGVPLRTVQRCFTEANSSLARELRRARADTAIALFAADAACSAAQGARDAGFGSVASMRRALRERHEELENSRALS